MQVKLIQKVSCMENLQGSHLKGYKLIERIGSGGFGAVYRAKQSTIGREVAVKVILPNFANNPDFIRRFESEAHLIARLEHPHITPLHDFWRDPDGAYLVMRYLRGGSIQDVLENENYALLAVSQLLDQLASALDFAHRNDVIHRDIKPGNVLLDEDGNAYLADFGIAKVLNTLTENHTAIDAVVGSLDYISPEQARGEVVTPRTDIYSLGVMLYEMITGEHPFRNATTIERLYKHINEPLPKIGNLPNTIEATINDIIQKATAKNPEHRYPDVLALAVAFRAGIGRGKSSKNGNIVEEMTLREQEILSLIVKGMSNREIADELVITIGTVKWHINQLYKKLGVRSRVQAIVRTRELNLIVTGDTTDRVPTSIAQTQDFPLPEPDNPYKGLRAFQMTDARDFFGRDELIQKMIDHLNSTDIYNRFLSIVGPSGSGKSSLVKAGLIPALWKGAIEGSEKWFVIDMIPSTHPLDKLETALIRIAANQANNLHEQLQRDERGLLRIADIILPNDDTELVIVVDQFEEVFTLVEDEDERQQFLDLLRIAVSDLHSRVRVIVTLRADYYDRPLHYPEFGELVRSRMETVLPLSAKGLERAIRGPAERVGVTFEQGLVAQIVSDMNYQAGALPLLQYALTELFDRREGHVLTHNAYQDIGGAVGALANRADEIFQSLADEAQALAHQMFMRLVTLGEGAEDTRRRANHSELLAIADNTDLMEEIIEQFTAYRLLSLDNDPETRQPTVEVAHEAILREWDRLRQWLNESRGDIRQERAVSNAAQDWNTHHWDTSYLLRGSRLEQVEQWQESSKLTLTPLERHYIDASLHQRENEHLENVQRQEREAQLEKRSQNFLRGLVAVFALATIIAGGFGIFALNRQNVAIDALDASEQSAAEFRSIALTFGAQDAMNDNQADMAIALALEANNMENPPQQAIDMFPQAASSSWIRRRYFSGDNAFDGIYFPDGERIITNNWEGEVEIWNVVTGEELQTFETNSDQRLLMLVLHPDSERVAFGSIGGNLTIWNTSTDQFVETFAEGRYTPGTFTSDGIRLVAANGGTINVLDVETLSVQYSFVAHPNASVMNTMRFNSDESLLLVGSADGYVSIWDFETGELIKETQHGLIQSETADGNWVWDAQFLNNDQWILIGGFFGITLWDWQNDEIVWEIDNIKVQDVALSPDKEWFIVGLSEGSDSNVQLYHTATGRLIRSYTGHASTSFTTASTSRTTNVDISPDGTSFVSVNNDGTAIEWALWWEGTHNVLARTSFPVTAATHHPSLPLTAIAPFPIRNSNNEIASVVNIIHDVTGEIVQQLTFDKEFGSLVFTSDGRYLLAGGSSTIIGVLDDSQVTVWDWQQGEIISTFAPHDGWVTAIDVSPDGKTVASGDQLGTQIYLWDLETGTQIHHLTTHLNVIRKVLFSEDGHWLYSTGNDQRIIRWNVETGELDQEYGDQTGGPFTIDLTSDGRYLITSSFSHVNRQTSIWDTESGEIVYTLDAGGIALLTEDDTMIVTMSYFDGIMKFWDFTTGEEIHRYTVYPPETGFGMWLDNEYRIMTDSGGITTTWHIPTDPIDLEIWIRENRHIPDFTCDQRDLYVIEPPCDE